MASNVLLSSTCLRSSQLLAGRCSRNASAASPNPLRQANVFHTQRHSLRRRCQQLVRPAGVRSVQVIAAAIQATPVKILIQGRRMTVTESIRAYVEEKVQNAVNHFTQNVKKVDVTISARGGDTGTKGPKEQKVDITVYTLRNGVVRVEDSESDLYASIDLVCDKLERKLRKLKERAIMKGNWPGKAGPHVDVDKEQFQEYLEQVVWDTVVFTQEERTQNALEEINKEYPQQVVRSKTLSLEPISVTDAIDQLEQLEHDFYVFREKETNSVQILYKRKSEGYGLIIPKN